MTLILTGILIFATSALIAALLLRWTAARAASWGLVDVPGGRKDHARPIPLVGGISILGSLAVVVGGGLGVASVAEFIGIELPTELSRHFDGLLTKAPQLLALLGGAALLLVVGGIDDRRGLRPSTRLVWQGAAAAGLVAADLRITVFLPDPWMHAALTVLFVVFVINATNFIDNMNGLLAGATWLAGLHLVAIAAATGQWFLAALGLALLGGLGAFLLSNYPRARRFLGDAGSTSLGFLLAGLTIAAEFHQGALAWDPILMPMLVLALPLADGIVVCIGRLRRGVHPFTAGHDHLSHRLARRGWTKAQAVVILWSCAWVCGALAACLSPGRPAVALIIEALGLFAIAPLAWRGWRLRAND